MPEIDSSELALVEDMAGFRFDPLGHVLYSYPWGVPGTPLERSSGPWDWHREFLTRVGERLRAGEPLNFADVVQEAVSSGHGVGKSALVSWLIRWALDTFEDTRVLVTANTELQLRTKTWPELAKWHRMAITRHWWVWTATSYYSAQPDHAANWRADAVTWSENNTEAFAGAHNAGKRLVILFDEASAIADQVWEVTEGALTDANTEIIWGVFGNPTQASGRFRECARKYKHRWHFTQVDARTVPGTNHALHEKWIEDNGIDSDFVKIRVRGMFPSMSVRGLFSEADVDAAFGRGLAPHQYSFAPVIITCDPAWTGANVLVIGKRQGLWYEILHEMPKNDNDVLAAQLIAQFEDQFQADAVFIDLGYGTGIASLGKTWGRTWELVGFGEAATDPSCKNKRAQMYRDARDWLKQGGRLPDRGPGANQLRENLLSIEVKPQADGKLLLESKEDMLGRGVESPDHSDAFVLSFARPVQKRAAPSPNDRRGQVAAEYKPHARLNRR